VTGLTAWQKRDHHPETPDWQGFPGDVRLFSHQGASLQTFKP